MGCPPDGAQPHCAPDPARIQSLASLLHVLVTEISFDILLAFLVPSVVGPSRWLVGRELRHWKAVGWERHLTLYEAASKYLNLFNFLKHHTLLSQRTVLTLAFPFFRS